MAEPVAPHHDPVTGRSMSGALLVSSILLLLSLFWALYDEFYGLRPWKDYQERFAQVYGKFLDKAIADQTAKETALEQSPSYQKLNTELEAARAAIKPREDEINAELAFIDRRLLALTSTYSEMRGEIGALTYQAEIASEAGKQRLQQQIDQTKQRGWNARLPTPEGRIEAVHYDFDALEEAYNGLKQRKADLLAELVTLRENVTALNTQLQAYMAENTLGLSRMQLEGLRSKASNFDVDIRQIHVLETDLVDRCESCHLGTREPVDITLTALTEAASNPGPLSRRDEQYLKAFVSHPNRELLRVHDPERFGCSPCHGGNGRATSSVVKGHGRHKYWLWPLYYRENFEAGCQQCHARDMVIANAETLNRGKELFRLKGCIGCHRFEGFDDERERLQATQLEIRQTALLQAQWQRDIQRSIQLGDTAPSAEEARRFYDQAEALRVRISGLDATSEQLRVRARSLLREEKKVGPNLKEIRAKLRPDWIPVWLQNPHAWRPTTKMPRFRLNDDEVRKISAFIWQTAFPDSIPRQTPGNAARGRQIFTTRGCLGCHSLGPNLNSGDFAADLSRVGEKVNYDYLVRWILNPRQRLRPYCPTERRDLTAEDYAKHGLPFVFDFDHSTCPNDGSELQVQQMTPMPILRLSTEEARDVATFLMGQRQQDPASYAKADFLNDKSLHDEGRFLVRHYGCAGCHEISGLEDEGRVGTELTGEGSKPIERLDFALLTEHAKRGVLPDGSPAPRGKWYDHKGFFENKLANPAVYDQDKIKPRLEQLKMPNPNVTNADISALTTFLLGSVDPGYGFPTDYLHRPRGADRDIQEGWWIVTKYNCMGCHVLRVGQQSDLMKLPQYQGDGKELLPPNLIGAGARLNPEWMVRFLENPSLAQTDTNRNGVRTYLQLRMPTFNFSQREIQVLVRFFQALSDQQQPYLPPKLAPLTEQERTLARQLFTHPAAPCLKCHATGDPAHDRAATAPNFVTAKERLKPAWTGRWIVDPASIIPGTAMPSGLFRREGGRWVFSAPHPAAARGYAGDHADLLVRYMFELTPEEQRRLVGGRAAAPPQQRDERALNLVKSH